MQDSNAERLARAGYVARGVVFVMVGGLAALAAMGGGGRTPDSHGALRTLLAQPYGAVMLGLLSIGLLCFAAWRVAQAVFDADHLGSRPKSIVRRIGYGAGAVVNGGLAISAASLIFAFSGGGSGGDQSARDWTAYLLQLPFGPFLVGAAGATVIGAGCAAAVKAWKASFCEHLALRAGARAWVVPLGRLGYAARAAVFGLAGAFLLAAAWHANAREARGLAGTLAALEAQPYGWLLLLATAAGLFAFGAFQFVAARYRRIDAPDLAEAGAKLRLNTA
ncbi:membrane protein [Alsobacter metallidurans]|uniref:Membrane protein n=1 Tax=Alsobacter metallidurans TaxID=340221 RepID=A0A917I515_9HYPH|nr:DUF1206 domain-containing protein [Alsobacter metallidurans]GGH09744.1 membrane protein [Alsobacter metallidurans]